jgi:hypothetical protein
MGKKIYYSTDSYGNKKYTSVYITSQDKRVMRSCRNTGRSLSSSEKRRIFGDENPEFVKR